MQVVHSAGLLICDAMASSSGQSRGDMQGFREMFSLWRDELSLKLIHLIRLIYSVLCVICVGEHRC